MSFQDKKQTNIDQQQTQKNINARLDKMNFRSMSETDFNYILNTTFDKPPSNQITFVTGSGFVHVYKGRVRIPLEGETGYYILKADQY